MTDNYMKIHPDDWRQLLGDIEQLRKDSYEANEISLKYEDRYFVALVERDEARRERDEARREVCRLMSMFNAENSVEIASSRSWDCFKETP